ncbi:phytoene desaturase family protein [Streptomyces sp. URMC 123]|uniref:phytoene desaturase family protein n=1 Tax=Streptomyces sp. URMC 123 TaxID=3423403 RepID=UPI003F1BC9BE
MARIAVIGAGMGAMAAAARLAVAGDRVTVYERSDTYGGGVRRFERDGFGFDTGPGLLHLPAVYRDLFVKTGKEPLEKLVATAQVDPAADHLFPDGTAVRLPNASRAGVVAALDAALGTGAGERWSELINRARDVWDATRRPLLEEPLRPDGPPLHRDPYPAVRRRFFRRGTPTLAEVARRELRDPRLIALLESHALAHGLDPRTAPASAVVLAYLEQTFGSWYVRGGMRALADALYERCTARKVEFVLGAEVVRVLMEDGRARGLLLADGSRVAADLVVSGMPVPSLYARGVVPGGDGGDGDGSPSAASAGAPGSRAAGAGPRGRLTLLLALRGARPADAAHRTVVHTPDHAAELAAVFGERAADRLPPGFRPTVTVLRPDDPELRPDDAHEAVTVTVTVPPHAAPGGTGGTGGTGASGGPVASGAVDWTAPGLAEAWAEAALASAERAVPDLRERLLWRVVRTPADTERETGIGAVPPPSLAGGRLHGANTREALPGLYLAGGWSHPGGGLPHAGMSGALVAGLRVNGDDWRGSQ